MVDVEAPLQREEIVQVPKATVQERLVQQMVEQAVRVPVPITEEEEMVRVPAVAHCHRHHHTH
eukprot:11901491-Alexandrium_andersonii.AAC.1